MHNQDILMEVKHLKKYFKVGSKAILKAVDDITFQLKRGETLGIVGESGCGKSTLGKTLIHLYDPTSGQIIFEGKDITKLSNKDFIHLSSEIQMIFQDPYASLNPRMTVGDIICEGYDIRKMKSGDARKKVIKELLELVGLNEEHGNRFPHEFSGGQRQRIGIARALSLNPKLIICDEPISALDVSIQAQVMNLLNKLQKEMGLTYIFVAHDLSMIKYISDRIMVMYLGTMVELADSDEVYSHPLHPYTQALFSANPIPDPDFEQGRSIQMLEGDIPSPINPLPGCRFASRCSKVCEQCRNVTPVLKEVKPNHFVACHLVQ